MAHFKSVHRGAFFQEMRTTEPRQLLPDAWGFICPVHTPDGAPCGLLNHLTMNCTVTDVADPEKVENIPKILVELSMVPVQNMLCDMLNLKEHYVTMLDGKIIGYIHKSEGHKLVDQVKLLN